MSKVFRSAGVICLVWCLSALSVSVFGAPAGQVTSGRIIHDVRHELRMLPYYGVYDWLEFTVSSNNVVTLRGQVVRPSTRSDAEAAVKKVNGVRRVVNQIQTLPVSGEDDRLRQALYRAIYNSDSPLFRYASSTDPAIHLIVDHGRATLKGVVGNKGDATQAFVRARTVPGLFDVKNELTVESEQPT